jgi:hypothetical protein
MRYSIVTLFFVSTTIAFPSPQAPSLKPEEEYGGGVFGLGMPLGGSSGSSSSSSGVGGLSGGGGNRDIQSMVCKPNALTSLIAGSSASTVDGKPICETDNTGGSGPYKANYTSDSSLPDHTIYKPTKPLLPGQKLQVLVWGNGGCFATGLMFQNFLTEIASHGWMIIATGQPTGQMSAQSKVSDLTKAIDWVTTAKLEDVDTTKLAVSGQSCGGLEAYSASYKDSRVKNIVIFNSGLLNPAKRPMLAQLKAGVPIAYFLGGKADIAGANVGGSCSWFHWLLILNICGVG